MSTAQGRPCRCSFPCEGGMFNGIWLVATEPLTIQGRDIKAGEQFHISRVHSGALLVKRQATVVHPQPPPKSQTPEPPPVEAPKRRTRTRKADVAKDAPDVPAVLEIPEAPAVAEPPAVSEPDTEPIDVPRGI